MPKRAVLLLAHGTPETVEQVPEYLRNVVSGRALSQSVVEEIQHRYSLIGRSPLTDITMDLARLVEEELAVGGEGLRVYVGMRNWRPYISDVVRQMHTDGVEEAAVICMAPQNSRTSVGLYRRAVEAEAGSALRIDFTEGWADHPLLAEGFADRLRPLLEQMSTEAGHPVPVLFTAHSVPLRTVQPPETSEGQPRLWPGTGVDPYAEDARRTAAEVAKRIENMPKWWFAFQSQGASGGPWIGPSVEETLDAIAGDGVRALILQPIGFLCDHVEILFDIDILFTEYGNQLKINLKRPESLNTSPFLVRAVADLARKGLERLHSKT
jgi:ferrochelatase